MPFGLRGSMHKTQIKIQINAAQNTTKVQIGGP